MQRVVMIGDSATDVFTARNAGIAVVAVAFGYSETPVSEFGPDRMISHFDELPEAIAAFI
jgi:phosphoglycolate phosphatase